MKLYNSLTKKTEVFEPLNPSIVRIYSCGPTVYNNLHIGNIAAFIYADILRRSLQINGYGVRHVMNITDVDDKTIRDSKIEYPKDSPAIALKKLTDKYTKVFIHDLKKTNVDVEQIEFISAVDTIPDMVPLTQKLLDNDIAYIADDGVYFSITKYYQSGHKYGLLQKVETQQSKARIINDEYDKDSASDFALWKKAEAGEPSWEASFSEDNMITDMAGRPGWHIECSAMSEKTLGVPFDIHTGGIDLKFPHHENEIAQSCGAGADKLANYFFHNNHILVDGRKMSKSAGNFYTLRDVENMGFSPEAFRLLVLESHYHSESNFSWGILESASNRLKNWLSNAETVWQLEQDQDTDVINRINEALADNINTPLVLKEIDAYFEKTTSSMKSPNKKVLQHIQSSTGISLLTSDIEEPIKKLLEERKKAREAKNWQLSDELRIKLATSNIMVRDDTAGQIWSRIS
jgi:cysteinyl-tRNA synthetase